MDIKYQLTAEQRKILTKECAWKFSKPFLIICIVCACIAIYCLTFGIMYDDRDTIIMGISSAIGTVIFGNLTLSTFLAIKRVRHRGILKTVENETLTCELKSEDNVINFHNLTLDTNSKMLKDQISNVKETKSGLIVLFEDKTFAIFPNLPEIAAEFLPYMKKKKKKKSKH